MQPANPFLIKTITCPSIHLLLNQPLSALAQCDSHLSSVFLSVLNSSYSHCFKKEQELLCVTLTSVPLPFSLCCLSSHRCSPYLFIPLSLIFFFYPLPSFTPCIKAFCCLYPTHSGPVPCLLLLCLGFLFGCTLSAFAEEMHFILWLIVAWSIKVFGDILYHKQDLDYLSEVKGYVITL